MSASTSTGPADSKRLHWALGPELYSRDLSEAFAFLGGAPEKLPAPPEHGIPIGFKASSDVPSGVVAVIGGKVITMRGDEVIEDGTVVIENNRIRAVGAPDEEYNHFNSARLAHDLAEQGVEVHIGAHGQREGLGAHWEMWMLVQGGMTPFQALRCATLAGAHYLGLDHDLGSLAPGKLADLLVLDADPLADIHNTAKLHLVIQNGRLFDPATLDQLGNHPHKREPFYWQLPNQPFAAAAGPASTDD